MLIIILEKEDFNMFTYSIFNTNYSKNVLNNMILLDDTIDDTIR